MKAFMGKILVVDLTTGEIKSQTVPDEIYYNFLSGKGLGAWYLYNNIPAGADPLGAENIIGFCSGALTGTGALMSGRFTICAKSPLTGGWGDSNCGGTFSPAIKQCGYDAIFVKGKSDKPVYLFCDNKGAEIRDAQKYWNRDAVEAEAALQIDARDKKKPCVAVIGQAGERLSHISGIVNEGGRIAARSGLGAVMGSKHLKAVVLAGSRPIPVENFEEVKKLSKKLGEKLKKASLPGIIKGGFMGFGGKFLAVADMGIPLDGIMLAMLFKRWGTSLNTPMSITSGDGPIKNWAGSVKDFGKRHYKKLNPDIICQTEERKYHCYSCGMGCGGILNIDKASKGEFQHTHRPEYETLQAFGALALNDDTDSILYINELLNRAGMDSISAGNTVAYAIECYERGILTKADTDGLELKWGNIEAIVQLVKKMIAREGFGDVLADGVRIASQKIGKGSEEYAMNIGGSEPGMHDSRYDTQLAVHYVAEPAPGKHTIGNGLTYSMLSIADYSSWAPVYKMHKKKEEYTPTEKEALKSVAMACYTMLTDGVGGCMYAQMFGLNHWNPALYLNAAVGWDRTFDDYMEVGRRIQTTRQLFNVKQGIDIKSIKLPKRMAGNPPLTAGPLKNKTLRNDEMVSLHWKLLGWDEHTGEPTEATLSNLGLDKYLKGEQNNEANS